MLYKVSDSSSGHLAMVPLLLRDSLAHSGIIVSVFPFAYTALLVGVLSVFN